MATSGTVTFQMTVDEIVAEAFEQLGIVPSALTGYDLKSGRRSLSLLLLEFSNRNVFAYIKEADSLSTVDGTATYNLDTDTNDVQHMTVAVNGQDLELQRYGYSDYSRIPNKTQEGRPVYAYVDRQRDGTSITLWPVPDGVYTIKFQKYRKIQDVGAYTNNIDIPVKALPAIISNLAAKLAMKRPNVVMNPDGTSRLPAIKAEAELQFGWVVEDDQERASTYITPDFRSRGR
jgi:hypothetical protein